jgi:hypothetical protein
MPYAIRPYRRFPVQCSVTYIAGPFQGQGTCGIPLLPSSLLFPMDTVDFAVLTGDASWLILPLHIL